MKDISDHFCPGCGKPQKVFLRYPWYFCDDCLNTAQNKNGRRYEFGNVSLSGGLAYRYSDETEMTTISRAICLIKDRPVLVTEARFGGVVAQPLNDTQLIKILRDKNSRTIDLRRGKPTE